MKLLLLTAGLGTRLRPHTLSHPKPLIPFLGVPLIQYAYQPFCGVVDQVYFNVHHQAAKLESYIAAEFPDWHCSDETTEILETGGAIAKLATQMNQENFWVANGDNVLLFSDDKVLPQMAEQHRKEGAIATLLVVADARAGIDFGAVLTKGKSVKGFSKTRVPELEHWHYLGIALYSPRLFDYFSKEQKKPNIFYDVLTRAIQNGERVQIQPVPEVQWFETGQVDEFLKATDYFLSVHQAPHSKVEQKFWLWWQQQKKYQPMVERQNPQLLQRVQQLIGSNLHDFTK